MTIRSYVTNFKMKSSLFIQDAGDETSFHSAAPRKNILYIIKTKITQIVTFQILYKYFGFLSIQLIYFKLNYINEWL